MEKIKLRKIVNYLKLNQFNEANDFIKENNLIPISDEDSLILLNYSCKNLKTCDCREDVVAFIKLLTIKELKDDKLLTYLQSVYFVLKYLIEKKLDDSIVNLRKVFYPSFVHNITGESLETYYKHMCSLIWNSITPEIVPGNQVSTTLLEKFKLLTSMRSVLKHDIDLEMVNCLKSLSYIGCSIKDLNIYFLHCLKIIKIKQIDLEDSSNFRQLMSLLSFIGMRSVFNQNYDIFHEALKETLALLKLRVQNQFKPLYVIKKTTLLLTTFDKYPDNYGYIFETCLITMQKYKDKYGPHFREIAVFAKILLCEFIKFNKDISNEVWSTKITANGLNSYFDYCNYLADTISQHTEYKCCCSTNYDVKATLDSLLLISRFTKYAISELTCNTVSDNVLSGVLKSFETCCVHLKVLKINNCKKLEELWYQVECYFYNFSWQLHKDKHKMTINYIKLLLKNVFAFKSVENKLIVPNIPSTVLDIYSDILYKDKKYLESLQIAALNIYLHPDNIHNASLCWVKNKTELKESCFTLTIVSILNSNENYFKSIYNDFRCVTKNDEIRKLLITELNIYIKNWNRSKSLLFILEELYKVSDALTFSKALMIIPIKNLIKLDKKFADMVNNTIEQVELEKKQDETVKIILGHLYYFRYKYVDKDLIEKNLNDMKNAKQPVKPEGLPHEEVQNINDECDLVSSYISLQLDTYAKAFKHLENCFFYLTDGIGGSLDCDFLKKFHTFKLLVEVAHEFELQCFTEHSIKVWYLALKVAQTLNIPEDIFQAMSSILKYVKVTSHQFNKMLNESKDLIHTINKTAENNILMLTYYTNLGFFYLKIGKIEDFKSSYVNATEYYYKLDENSDEINVILAKMNYAILQMQLLNLPCENSLENHAENAIVKLHLAYRLIMQYSKDFATNYNLFGLILLFEITEHLLSFYLSMYMPREVRCYGRDIVLLAQGLVIPFRTSRLLLYLAKSDLLNCRFDDCDIKLEGLSDILCLSSHKSENNEKNNIPNNSVDKISFGLENMMLEYRSTAQSRVATAASPILYHPSFKLPLFLSHPDDCNCIPCISYEFHNLVIQKIHLNALISECRNNISSAGEYYKGISVIYKHVKTKRGYLSTSQNFNLDYFEFTYNKILLDIVKYYLKYNLVQKAQEQNKFLLGRIENDPKKDYLLYNEVLNLEIKLLMKVNNYNVSKASVKSEVDNNDSNCPTTPESKLSKVGIQSIISPLMIPPSINIRAIPFELSDTDKSPTFYAPKTPKFTIFTPSTNKSKKTKTNAIKNSSKKIDLFNDIIKSNNIVENLPSRTRKLTEKLKSTSKTSSKISIPTIIVSDQVTKISKAKNTVRKNLINEFIEPMTEVKEIETKTNGRSTRSTRSANNSSTHKTTTSSTTGAIRKTRKVIK